MNNDRMEFLKRRKSGIGGSDVAAVLGASKWKTPFELWKDKTSDNIVEIEESDIIHFGNVLESVVAAEFARRHGVKVQKRNKLYRHPEHPELIANIDRYIVGGEILECKTCSAYASSKFGKDGDDVPEEYYMQIQHYMFVLGAKSAWLAVLIGGNEYRDFHIEYDPEWAEFAAGKCVEFWKNYVVPCIPPPPSEKDKMAEYYTDICGSSIIAPETIIEACDELKNLKAEKKSIENRIENVKFSIERFAGNNEFICDPAGGIIATWKRGKDRAAVDIKALCEAHNISAEEIAKYTKYSVNRPLNVK